MNLNKFLFSLLGAYPQSDMTLEDFVCQRLDLEGMGHKFTEVMKLIHKWDIVQCKDCGVIELNYHNSNYCSYCFLYESTGSDF